jgi:hypothetical protein
VSAIKWDQYRAWRRSFIRTCQSPSLWPRDTRTMIERELIILDDNGDEVDRWSVDAGLRNV